MITESDINDGLMDSWYKSLKIWPDWINEKDNLLQLSDVNGTNAMYNINHKLLQTATK